MTARGVVVAACALAVIATSGATAAGGPAAAVEPQPVRILIVGDSVTQGSTGDWTWRYRLWQHLLASGVSVDFVGPRDDLFDRASSTFGSHDYVDPLFDQDHAAGWGTLLTAQDQPIGDLVSAFRPDVVIEMLGLNDLVNARASSAQLHDELVTFVSAARAADPGIDIVLGELPQVWIPSVADFNTGFPIVAQSLDRAESRVLAAPTGEAFVERLDSYDTQHPSATGEVKIAAGFADTLALLGIGSAYPRPLPRIPNGPRQAATLSVKSGDRSAILSWQAPPGATGQFVWVRDGTAKESWNRLSAPAAGTSWILKGLANFHRYKIRLQPAKGTAVSEDIFSNTVEVTPGPPAVSSLTVKARRHGLRVRWKRLASVSGYRVAWWPTGHPNRAAVKDTKRRATILKKLIAGRAYRVKVTTLTYGLRGPAASTTGVPSGPRVKGPSSLRVARGSVVATRLVWPARKKATRYEVWRKLGSGRWRSLSWTRRSIFDPPRSHRGVAQSFRVRSWHQRLPGGWSPTRKLRP